MPGTIPAARRRLIAAVAAASKGIDAPMPLAAFVHDYYRGVDDSDLRSAEPATLAALAAGHLRFGARRRPGQALVRVFNPVRERDGWESQYTAVEVVTDDMPFLVDSLAMVLNASGLSIQAMTHPVLGVKRDRAGRLLEAASAPAGDAMESWQHVAVDRVVDETALDAVRRRIDETLGDVRVAVEDWPRMMEQARAVAVALAAPVPGIARTESGEAAAFLDWLIDNHFTFLGYREYRLERGASTDRLVAVPRTGLGLLSTGPGRPRPRITELRGEVRERAREPALLVVTKANSVSTIHRATYLDYVGIKTFDARGRVTGERRFIGLFTSATYSANPRSIPLLRHKVQRVIDHFGISPVSHDGKALMHVLETHPRDELFQSSVAELVDSFRGIVNLYERRRVRLLLRRDPYACCSCRATATTRRRASASSASCSRSSRATRSRPGCRFRSRRWRACTCSCVPIRAAMSPSTSRASRRASPTRCAPGKTGCATRCRPGSCRPAAPRRSRGSSRARSRPLTRRTSPLPTPSRTCSSSPHWPTGTTRWASRWSRTARAAARTCGSTGVASPSPCRTCCRCSRTSACAC